MFTPVYPRFTPFPHVYSSLSMFYSFKLVNPSLFTFYPFYLCLLYFIHVLLCLTSFTPAAVYPCFTPFTRVYPCLSTFYPVSPCLRLFIHILLCLTSFTPVYSRFTLFTYLYPSLPEVTLFYHSLAQVFIMLIHSLYEKASSSITYCYALKKDTSFSDG